MTADATARRWRAEHARLAAMERIAFAPQSLWALQFDVVESYDHTGNVRATVRHEMEISYAYGQ